MKYETVQGYKAKEFRSVTGVTPLSEEEKVARKAENKRISSVRMKIEHIIGRIKNFKIVAEKYRNRRKRPLTRFNLIYGIVNFQNQ